MSNPILKITACAPPLCKCSELEIYETIDGDKMVMLSDDQQHVCAMTADEFAYIAKRFLAVYETGIL